MSNAIVPAGGPPGSLELPEYARKYLQNQQGYAQDVGDITTSDIGLNFLKMVQGLSKEAKPGWNGAGSLPLPQGAMILSRDKTVLPVGTVVIPLLRKTRYVLWEGRPGNGQMLHQTEYANDPKIIKTEGLAWKRDTAGDQLPPAYTKYVNFWVISQHNPEEPAVLSFYRTSLKVAKTWTSDLLRKTKTWKLPLFLFRYRLGEPFWVPNGEASWPQFTVSYAGHVPEADLPKIEAAHATAQALYNATSAQAQIYLEAEEGTPDALDPEDADSEAGGEIDLPPSELNAQMAATPAQPPTQANIQTPPAKPLKAAKAAKAPKPAEAAATEKPVTSLWG
jgi:hypothetical protein